jgi:hypothetical protein
MCFNWIFTVIFTDNLDFGATTMGIEAKKVQPAEGWFLFITKMGFN